MQRAVHHLSFLILTAFLTGCAGGTTVAEPTDANASFVYGYIGMRDSPASGLHALSLRKAGVKEREPVAHLQTAGDGAFFGANLPRGKYEIGEFAGAARPRPAGDEDTPKAYTFDPPRQSGFFIVERPGVQYVGAYNFRNIGTGEGTNLSLWPTREPSEAEVIKMVLPKVKGTKWETQLRSRLEQLQGGS